MIMPGYAIVIPCKGIVLRQCQQALQDIQGQIDSVSPMQTEKERLPPHLTLAAVKMHPAEATLQDRLQRIARHNASFSITPIGWGIWILEKRIHIHLRWKMNTPLLSLCEECQQILNHDATQVLPYYRFPSYVAKTTLLHRSLTGHELATLTAYLQQHELTIEQPAMTVNTLQLVIYQGLNESVLAEFPLLPNHP